MKLKIIDKPGLKVKVVVVVVAILPEKNPNHHQEKKETIDASIQIVDFLFHFLFTYLFQTFFIIINNNNQHYSQPTNNQDGETNKKILGKERKRIIC